MYGAPAVYTKPCYTLEKGGRNGGAMQTYSQREVRYPEQSDKWARDYKVWQNGHSNERKTPTLCEAARGNKIIHEEDAI